MQKTRLSDRRRASGPRLLPLATLAAGSAAALLAMVWHDATRFKPPGSQRAIELAQNALQAHGYQWARVNVRNRTLHILGRAPDDRSRIMAYAVTRRALRPLMGQDASIDAIRSHLGLNLGAERPDGNRIAAGPDLDVASILPPPMPLIHGQDERDGTLEVASSLSEPEPQTEVAKAETPPAPEETVAEASISQLVPEPSSNAEPPAEQQTTAAPEGTVAEASSTPVVPEPSPKAETPAEQQAAAAPAPEPRKVEFFSESETSAKTAEVAPTATPAAATKIETASLDKHPAAGERQTAGACAQTFANTLSSSTISFGRDSAVIERESRPLLDQLAAIAKRCKAYRFVVEGHTDLTGTSAHNTALSKKRAEAVRWALIDRGVDMDHVTAEGYGASRPLERSTSDAANARNRRIAINVIEPPARK